MSPSTSSSETGASGASQGASDGSSSGGRAETELPAGKEKGRWLSVRERGGVFGIRFVVFLGTCLGRGAARLFIALLAFWYFVFDCHARRTSRLYLRRVTGREPSRRDVFRHILTFARVSLDRLFFAAGKTRPFHVEFHGEEYMRELRARKKGALLIMAHAGSFECGRALAYQREFAINVIGNFHNAAMVTEALERLNPAVKLRLIDVGKPGDVDFVLQIQKGIEDGELVAVMADRVGLDGKRITADFMGSQAPFPTGPYQLAAILGCPVYFACGLYTEPNRYDLYCEPFAERVVLNRRDRMGSLAPFIQKYAATLERYVRMAPLNWFNFFDFWEEDAVSAPNDASASGQQPHDSFSQAALHSGNAPSPRRDIHE